MWQYMNYFLEAIVNDKSQEISVENAFGVCYQECSCGFKRESDMKTLPMILPVTVTHQNLQSCSDGIFNPEVIDIVNTVAKKKL